MARLAFIGLGVMGYPMAGHLQRAGHAVSVFNRSPDKAFAWQAEFAGVRADSPAAAVAGAEAAFCCLGNDDSVRQMLLGPQGVLEGLDRGAVIVDHTTASARLAREIADVAQQRGVGFVDAPVSGGQAGAQNGSLTVMAGGRAEEFARVEPLIRCYARSLRLMGPAGAGQLTKMVNQICVAGAIGGLAEGLHFARAAGLDPYQVIDVIAKGAAQSWQMDHRHATMLAGHYEHGFAVDWMRKDLDIVMGEARGNGSSLPITALIDQLYAEVQAMGGGRWDTSSLFARLERHREIARGKADAGNS